MEELQGCSDFITKLRRNWCKKKYKSLTVGIGSSPESSNFWFWTKKVKVSWRKFLSVTEDKNHLFILGNQNPFPFENEGNKERLLCFQSKSSPLMMNFGYYVMKCPNWLLYLRPESNIRTFLLKIWGLN